MGTRLGGHGHTLAARGIHHRQALGAAHVHHVRPHAVPRAAHTDEQTLDCLDLSGRWARATPRQPLDALLCAPAVEQFLTLGVHPHDRAEARRGLETDREHTIGHARKVVDAAVAHEGLEADDAALMQRLQLREVVGHHATP